MKKLFISADIEGTCGIAHWDETEKGKESYAYFAQQMSREVAAACEGALRAGATDILVKDAHDSARNINPELLPQCARILRGWCQDPFCMMAGLDDSFDGVVFTGYHSPVGTDFNPLAHTMTTGLSAITINGEVCSELMISCLIASMLKVPVYCVTGDEGLCRWISKKLPSVVTVPVSSGMGNGSVSIHPALAVERIRAGVEAALSIPKERLMYPMPGSFHVEISYKKHHEAKRAGLYPGASQTGPNSIAFDSESYMDVLAFFSFVL